MKSPRLSICIPTYNRCSYLSETITSIISQVMQVEPSLVEICVSDNASTDGTEALIRDFQSNTSVRIVYSKNDTNLGADANYLRVVELASGDYCWYMGSDDVAIPGSLARFLHEIEEEHDIYLCNRIDCDIEMNHIRDRYWLNANIHSEIFDFSDPNQFIKYANYSKSVGALFGYLSSIVFKRKKWEAINIDPIFIGSAYSHAYMLLSFVKTGCKMKYLSDHLVKSRGGNDSFWSPTNEGIIKRIMIDIDGYLMLAERLFAYSPAHFNGVLRVLHAERPSIKTLSILRLRADDQDWNQIGKRCKKAGYSALLIHLIGMMKPVLAITKRIRDYSA